MDSRQTKAGLAILVSILLFFAFRLYDRWSTERQARQAIVAMLEQLPDYGKKKEKLSDSFEAAHSNAFPRHYRWSWDRRKGSSFNEVQYVTDVFGMMEAAARAGNPSDAEDLIRLQVAMSIFLPDDNPLKQKFADQSKKLAPPEPVQPSPPDISADMQRLKAELLTVRQPEPPEEISPLVTIKSAVLTTDAKRVRKGAAVDLLYLSHSNRSPLAEGCYRLLANSVPDGIDWSSFDETGTAEVIFSLSPDDASSKTLRALLAKIKDEADYCIAKSTTFSSIPLIGPRRERDRSQCDCNKSVAGTNYGTADTKQALTKPVPRSEREKRLESERLNRKLH